MKTLMNVLLLLAVYAMLVYLLFTVAVNTGVSLGGLIK